MKIEVNDDFVDTLIVKELVDCYVSHRDDTGEDGELINDKEFLGAITTLLDYYMAPHQLEDFYKNIYKRLDT